MFRHQSLLIYNPTKVWRDTVKISAVFGSNAYCSRGTLLTECGTVDILTGRWLTAVHQDSVPS